MRKSPRPCSSAYSSIATPEVQSAGGQLLLPGGQRGDDLHQPLVGRRPGQLQEHVALRPGDDHGWADRPAALAHHRPGGHLAAEHHADAAALDAPRRRRTAGWPPARPELRPGRRPAGNPGSSVLVRSRNAADRERVGVDEHRGHPVVGARSGRPPICTLAGSGGLGDQPERADVDAGEHRGPGRDRGAVLLPPPVADHSARGGPDRRAGAGELHRPAPGRGGPLRDRAARGRRSTQSRSGVVAVQPGEGLRDGHLGRALEVRPDREAVAEASAGRRIGGVSRTRSAPLLSGHVGAPRLPSHDRSGPSRPTHRRRRVSPRPPCEVDRRPRDGGPTPPPRAPSCQNDHQQAFCNLLAGTSGRSTPAPLPDDYGALGRTSPATDPGGCKGDFMPPDGGKVAFLTRPAAERPG